MPQGQPVARGRAVPREERPEEQLGAFLEGPRDSKKEDMEDLEERPTALTPTL